MKKLKLNELTLSSAEVLTREQLRKVLGGDGSGGGGGNDCCLYTGCVGNDCFVSGSEGCGILHCFFQTPDGNCTYTIQWTAAPPCGWA